LSQISAGLAWHYKKYQKGQTETDRILYSEAENEAREAKLGLWQDPHAVAPWEYRARRRKLRVILLPRKKPAPQPMSRRWLSLLDKGKDPQQLHQLQKH
jgi:hypothetical protein